MTAIPGLFYHANFIPKPLLENLELEYSVYNPDWTSLSTSPKSRQVIHYGQVYDYKIRTENHKNTELVAHSFTPSINQLVDLVYKKYPFIKGKLQQGIANQYRPGEGINKHIDDVGKYADFICCFTIGSGALMVFEKNGIKKELYVEPGSLYIMSGEARYEWSHCLPARKSDMVDGEKVVRGRRVSLTFRVLK